MLQLKATGDNGVKFAEREDVLNRYRLY